MRRYDRERVEAAVVDALARVAKKNGAKQAQAAAAKCVAEAKLSHERELERVKREAASVALERDQLKGELLGSEQRFAAAMGAKEAENGALRDEVAQLQALLFSTRNQLEVARTAEATAQQQQQQQQQQQHRQENRRSSRSKGSSKERAAAQGGKLPSSHQKQKGGGFRV